jgi:hypothetical protein
MFSLNPAEEKYIYSYHLAGITIGEPESFRRLFQAPW